MILQDKSFLIITNPLQEICHGSQVTDRMCFCHFDRREKSPRDAEGDFSHSFEMTPWPGLLSISTAGRNLLTIRNEIFSHPFEMTAFFQVPAKNLLRIGGNHI